MIWKCYFVTSPKACETNYIVALGRNLLGYPDRMSFRNLESARTPSEESRTVAGQYPGQKNFVQRIVVINSNRSDTLLTTLIGQTISGFPLRPVPS